MYDSTIISQTKSGGVAQRSVLGTLLFILYSNDRYLVED